MKVNLSILILLFFVPLFLMGQDFDVFLNGLLLEKTNREPVAFATIRVKDKAIGVISNKDGSFRIPKSFQESGDFLEISSMGYGTLTIEISSLFNKKINVIFLTPAIYELNEANVNGKLKRLSAEDIIRYAINNIKVNYPQDKFAYVGYYRDYQMKQNQYVNLNESIIEVLDKGFKTIDTVLTDFIIHDYRKNLDFEVDSFAAKPYDYKRFNKIVPGALIRSYGGNELILLRVHDAIRNYRINSFSYVYQLSKDFIDNHKLSIKRTIYYHNEPVYEISVFKRNEKYRVAGSLFIDKNSFAIRKFDYTVFKYYQKPKVPKMVETSFDLRNEVRLDSSKDEIVFEVQTEYRASADKKMYLNYISFHNVFEISRPPKFQIEKMVLNGAENELEMYFNRNTVNFLSLKSSDFKISYLGKKITNNELIKISPKRYILKMNPSKNKKKKELLRKLFSKNFDSNKVELEVDIKRAIDRDGNHINEPGEFEKLNQFREFFTQEVVAYPKRFIAKDSLMQKDFPLDNEKQPICMQCFSSDYWMNTPLQPIKK